MTIRQSSSNRAAPKAQQFLSPAQRAGNTDYEYQPALRGGNKSGLPPSLNHSAPTARQFLSPAQRAGNTNYKYQPALKGRGKSGLPPSLSHSAPTARHPSAQPNGLGIETADILSALKGRDNLVPTYRPLLPNPHLTPSREKLVNRPTILLSCA